MGWRSAPEAQPDGPYALSAGGASMGGSVTYAWRMNVSTGEMSLCGVLAPQLIFSAKSLQGEKDRFLAKQSKLLREGGYSEEEVAAYLGSAEVEAGWVKEAEKVKAETAELSTPKCSPWGPVTYWRP